jgi:hypothetical protein
MFRSWATRFVLFATLAVGAFLNRAAVHGPLVLDDFMQRALIEGETTPHRGPFNLYDFISNDNRGALLDRGAIPWWSDPHLSIRFLRPLPSVLIWGDHRLFGYTPVGPHVVSFLCWVLAVLAAYHLYRAALGEAPAALAAAIFALSPTLAIPLLWLANRDVLLTLMFGSLALAFYVRWRQDRSRFSAVGSAVAFGLSALTGEYALCLLGYLAAFEICVRGESARRRLTGLLPAVVPLVLYGATHTALRYGTAGSGFYRDPMTDPGGYVRAVPRVLSVLLGSSWLGANEASSWLSVQPLSALIIVGGIVLVGVATWLARRASLGADSRSAAWLAFGSVLALLPLAATEPTRRILGIAALGASGALGFWMVKAARALRSSRLPAALLRVLAIGLIGYVHLVAAPLETRRLSRQAVEDEDWSLERFTNVKRMHGPPETALVVRANYPQTVLWTPFVLGAEAPRRWRVLSYTFEQTVAVRTSPTSIDVLDAEGPLFPLGRSDMFRTIPFTVGDHVEIPGMRATVSQIDAEGQPKAVHYEFGEDLDRPNVGWISEGRSGFGSVAPPPLGIGVRLAP